MTTPSRSFYKYLLTCYPNSWIRIWNDIHWFQSNFWSTIIWHFQRLLLIAMTIFFTFFFDSRYYTSESANRVARHRCIEKFAGSNDMKHFSEHNNREDCESNGGAWTALYSMLELAPQYTTQSQVRGFSVTKRGVWHWFSIFFFRPCFQCESDHDDEMSYKWGTPYDPAKFDTFTPITDVCFVQPPPVDCRVSLCSGICRKTNHVANCVIQPCRWRQFYGPLFFKCMRSYETEILCAGHFTPKWYLGYADTWWYFYRTRSFMYEDVALFISRIWHDCVRQRLACHAVIQVRFGRKLATDVS